jgi:hypothetical protein
MEDLVIPEVLVELMETTHLLTQKEILMHQMIMYLVQRCPLSDNKE